MNTTVSIRDLFRSLCIALVVMLALATLARAEEKPAPVADQPAAAEKAEVAEPPAPAAPAATEEKSGLRHLDVAPATKSDDANMAGDNQDKDADEPRSKAPAKKKKVRTYGWSSHANGNQLVSVGHNSHLAKGEMAEAVVSVFGSSTSEGEVSDAVVSVFGDTRVTGPVGGEAVAVLGSTYVNSHVHGEVVAVGGDVELGPLAEVDGEIVAVGGTVLRDANAITHSQVNSVSFGEGLNHWEGLRAWLYQCAFRGRMLGFGPNLGWAWGLAFGFLAFYLVLALLFRDAVEKSVQTFESRPGYSILTALLSVLIVPIVAILLAITGVGLVIVPLIMAGIFFATLFGKAVMLAWFGRRFTKTLGLNHPALDVFVGGVLVLVLYLVPVIGIIVYKLLGWVGMGVVIYTLIQGMKREKPAVPPASASVPVAPSPVDPVAAMAADPLPGVQAPPVIPVAPPPAPSLALLVRAGFWHRTAALLIDVVLVGIILAVLARPHGSLILPGLAIYGAVMWKLKGTTIGGIICGLKVVRLDDRPIDWATAVVRALACFLSLAVCFLGFIWVAFDGEKQSWHDKIAGTVVVKSPKGTALV